jgi:hypothetical protein
MATSRPFSYNTGSTISGTEQVGNLAIGTPTSGFSSTGLKWWNGPDEDLGYVIAHQTPSGQSGADGGTAYLGFFRSTGLTDNSFIELSNTISGQSFTGGTQAKTWLNSNGYWTSWVLSGPTLLANLDASNSSSYGGSGSVWYDLTSNNNDGTLTAGSGSISYGTTDGGEFDLNGGSGTLIRFSNNSDLQLSTSTTKTYSVWFKADAVGFMSFSRTIMCKMQGLGGSSTSDGFIMQINSSNQLIARVTSDNGSTNKYISGIGATISTGTWYMGTLVVKVSSNSDTFKLYINTTEVGSTNGGGSSLSSDNRDLLLGNYDSGIQNAMAFDGKIGDFYVYEGDFTSTDVTTLFNNTKTRFGY